MKISEIQRAFLFIVIFVIIFIFVFMAIFTFYENSWIPNENTTRLTYEKCCGGSFCTDTYYNDEKDLCVLSLCESSIFSDKEDCYYKPTK